MSGNEPAHGGTAGMSINPTTTEAETDPWLGGVFVKHWYGAKFGENKISVHNASRREINCATIGTFSLFPVPCHSLIPSRHGRSSSTSRPRIQGHSRRRGYVQRHLSRRLPGAMVSLVRSSISFGFSFIFFTGLFFSFTQCRFPTRLGTTVGMN